MSDDSLNYTVLSGGVGGAKLVLGLHHTLPAQQLTVIANTGDDFVHLGLPVSPDIDTLMYTLSHSVNTATGWGRNDESWHFMDAVSELNGADWFRIGDRDLATHVRRLDLSNRGKSLTEATRALFHHAGLPPLVIPMSDAPAPTRIKTSSEIIDFQDYFVRQRAQPKVVSMFYGGTEVTAAPAAVAALDRDDLGAIIVTPSNPWLSIDPILSTGAIKSTITNSRAPVVAVSPIVGGKAIKGPTAKLMTELGLEVSALTIAEHYREILDGIVIDTIDKELKPAIESLGLRVEVSNTIMTSLQDKQALAGVVVNLAASLRAEPG